MFLLVEGPTAADWLEAWATLAGAVLSSIAVLVAILLLRHEHRLRLDQLQDAEATQARLVSGDVRAYPGTTVREGTFDVQVRNRSADRITDVRVQLLLGESVVSSSSTSLDEAPPHTGPHVLAVNINSAAVVKMPPQEPDNIVGLPLLAEIFFTDAAGRYWRRIEMEEPKRLYGLRPQKIGVFYLLLRYLHIIAFRKWGQKRWTSASAKLERFLTRKLNQRADRHRDRSKRQRQIG